MPFESSIKFKDAVIYDEIDMSTAFNGVFGAINKLDYTTSGLNAILNGGYILFNGFFISFVGSETIAITANSTGFIYLTYDFDDNTYSFNYASTVPSDSGNIKNIQLFIVTSSATSLTLGRSTGDINNDDTGWIYKTGYRYRRKNGWVFINFQITLPASTNSFATFDTLPVGYRPTDSIFCNLQANVSATAINNSVNIRIAFTGAIDYINPNTTTGYIGSVSYPVG